MITCISSYQYKIKSHNTTVKIVYSIHGNPNDTNFINYVYPRDPTMIIPYRKTIFLENIGVDIITGYRISKITKTIMNPEQATSRLTIYYP